MKLSVCLAPLTPPTPSVYETGQSSSYCFPEACACRNWFPSTATISTSSAGSLWYAARAKKTGLFLSQTKPPAGSPAIWTPARMAANRCLFTTLLQVCRHHQGCHSPHPPSQFRHRPAPKRRRPTQRPGPARARQYSHHPNLHSHHRPPAQISPRALPRPSKPYRLSANA
jgi:hypothetical protein